MKITKDLRLSFNVESEKFGTVLVHSSPIGRETFELYFAELGAVFRACYGEDDGPVHLAMVGPRIAYVALKKAAIAMKTWNTPAGVEAGLVNELIRLTFVAYVPEGGQGWQTIPLATAQAREVLDADEVQEVLNSLVFFTAACKAGSKKLVESMLPVIGESIAWEFGFSTLTAYIASWEKSIQETKPGEIEEPQKASSIIA